MARLTVEQALGYLDEARALAFESQVDEACFRLSWAGLTLREAGRTTDWLRAQLLLAWCQDLDGRSWQAAKTLEEATSGAGFDELPPWVRARALYTYARALWFVGEYSRSLEKAMAAYDLASESTDRGRAVISAAQAFLSLGQVDQAEQAFHRAVELDGTLSTYASSKRAYLLNLAGKHAMALIEAEKGLSGLSNSYLGNIDRTNRAVESSALLVERATAKAFLGHSDAREAVRKARESVATLLGRTELELARLGRALALDLARHGEPHAAMAMLTDSSKVFARHGARAEYVLTSRVLSYAIRKGGVHLAEHVKAAGGAGPPRLAPSLRGRSSSR